ncbi:MAG: outer membrane lipoprotein chaperone LolA [Gammaproteobacteria bacterium]|nr:outer membrane lipoprotein chaperone LolA [Gammaproteobacteria bacterium]
MRFFSQALLLFSLLPFGLQASEGERLQAYVDNLKTLRAEFVQRLYDDKDQLIQESRGRFLLQRPGQFRWDYEKPYAQLIVSDGKKVWVYDQDLAQVTVKKLDMNLGSAPILLLSQKQPLAAAFQIMVLGKKDDLSWYKLTPHQEESDFSEIFLALDQQGLKVMELKDGFGQATQIRFMDLESNIELDKKQFHFSPPEGVDVIGDL